METLQTNTSWPRMLLRSLGSLSPSTSWGPHPVGLDSGRCSVGEQTMHCPEPGVCGDEALHALPCLCSGLQACCCSHIVAK